MSKVVLITGASSGIGKTTAEYLTQKGFKVYGTSRSPKQNNLNFELITLDLNNIESIQNAVQYVIEKEDRIDVLINNAGTGITGPIEETPTLEIHKAFETNFFGVIEVMKAVLPQMRKQKSGLIINVTSIAGYMGLPFRGIYSATKSALERVTETIRMEVKKFGIEVTNIAPGDFATNIAAGRYHTPVFEKSPYKKVYQKNLDLMDEHVNSGGNPIEIAIKIHKIIKSPNPKIHYKVGSFIQKSSIVLKQILPNKIYEYLIMKHYRL
ncbi:MAG: SDR family oxidoreductase [Methanosarcinales archaeon]|nr:SDR family oxidoreductase [Methanosarcinales archaeon]